ncbi:unnamed protein product [Bemisia tabaci]|nr:unnamed protein product [Bemisia tabaci]
MKRAAAAKRIERYFYQLTDGCGNENCSNKFCASSGKAPSLKPNQAAVLALELFKEDSPLCEYHPAKIPRTQEAGDLTPESFVSSLSNVIESASSSEKKVPSASSELEVGESLTPTTSSNTPTTKTQTKTTSPSVSDKDCTNKPYNASSSTKKKYLTEKILHDILETCKETNSYSALRASLYQVFSEPECLYQSFLKSDSEPAKSELYPNLKKEEVRELEGEMEKDQDSVAVGKGEIESCSDYLAVDIASLRRAYKELSSVPASEFEDAFVRALLTLADQISIDLQMCGKCGNSCNLDMLVQVFVIVFEIPMLERCEYLETALPKLCTVASLLPLAAQSRLARVWARHSKPRLKNILEALQQLVSSKVVMGTFTSEYFVQDDEAITAATKVMKILYFANLLAGELDSPELREEDLSDCPISEDSLFYGFISAKRGCTCPADKDPLGEELNIDVLDARTPFIPFSEFYNEPLSDVVEMDKDFANYKSSKESSGSGLVFGMTSKKFSFMHYSFILTPATKTLGLYYDNRIRMYSERRISLLRTVVGTPTNPYLRLKVRRDHIIKDALVELEMIAAENPKNLKKQLVVEFEGEQGIDEGGVSKEFFQLIVEEIFNPDYGMFTLQPETRTMWFNTTSFESDAQFTLIGIVLGLAIYNNVILDVHFPMVVYRKLMGKKGTYYDLEDFNKSLYSGLKSMLDHEDDDMQDTFMQTFRICYEDAFGSVLHHDLKENGDQIYVNQINKKEFVDLYSDFLLNTSVDKQFKAFRRGFEMVTDESPLHLLFRPEEVEQLICGSKSFNMNELEEATEYDGGYTSETQIIKDFWEIVHALPLESQRKLLQFATGSDRVPVGGLSKLKLIIARNGCDSDRLPTAHTCFNVILLPEYSSKEKLNDRLIKAINYSKGFGML